MCHLLDGFSERRKLVVMRCRDRRIFPNFLHLTERLFLAAHQLVLVVSHFSSSPSLPIFPSRGPRNLNKSQETANERRLSATQTNSLKAILSNRVKRFAETRFSRNMILASGEGNIGRRIIKSSGIDRIR